MIPDHKGVGLSRRETFEIIRSRSSRVQACGFSVGCNARSTYTLC